MKKFILGVLLLSLLSHVQAAEVWLTELAAAKTRARSENKMVLLNFTSSDRVGWITKFKKEILDTPEFEQYAAANLVLVELDFPRAKPQDAELKKANAEAGKNFKVGEFPTFVLLNKDGEELGRHKGYIPGGPKAFIARLESFKKKN